MSTGTDPRCTIGSPNHVILEEPRLPPISDLSLGTIGLTTFSKNRITSWPFKAVAPAGLCLTLPQSDEAFALPKNDLT